MYTASNTCCSKLYKKLSLVLAVRQIIGNLIYYRYINSAIVAPDAFDIIDVSASKALSNDQRRNLGSIAKILQFAASNKGFGGDSRHLECLNTYIIDAHQRFKLVTATRRHDANQRLNAKVTSVLKNNAVACIACKKSF